MNLLPSPAAWFCGLALVAAASAQTPARETSTVGSGGAPSSAFDMKWPVTGRATSRVGPRWGRFHAGRDIACSYVPVRAAYGGKVTRLGSDPKGYGFYVDVTHAAGYMTRYAHLSRFVAKLHQTVALGQQIAVSGNTGSSTGPHVHFEIRRYGAVQTPYWDAKIALTTHRYTEFIPVDFPGLGGGGGTTGKLKGVLYDKARGTGTRLGGATVALANGLFARTRASDDYFEFTLPAGTYRYAGTAPGHDAAALSRAVPRGGEIWGSIGLPPANVPRLTVNPAPAAGATIALNVYGDPGSPIGLVVSRRPRIPLVSLRSLRLGLLWTDLSGSVTVALGNVWGSGVYRPGIKAPGNARGATVHLQAVVKSKGAFRLTNGAALKVR